MSVFLEHLIPNLNETFFIGEFDLPYFGTPWHYHPEYELVLVVKSVGKRFIGNSVTSFKSGDLTFMGPNLPHLYRNPPEYYAGNPEFRAKSIVIHFSEHSIGKEFIALPQMKKVRELFFMSQKGIDIYGDTKNIVVFKMKEMLKANELKRLILLLEIFNILSISEEYELVSDSRITGHSIFDIERLNIIFQYISENFDKNILLKDVASKIHMARCSFCRFFKAHTKKTFSEYLIDIRLRNVASLLVEGSKSIEGIAFESGYSSLSNFNRQFKKKFDLTPKQYQKQYNSITTSVMSI